MGMMMMGMRRVRDGRVSEASLTTRHIMIPVVARKNESTMSATIAVTFVDRETGKPFAVSDIPLEQLPESFVPATQMTIADVEWQVIAAEPMTAAEFARTGRLTLTLAKILSVPTKDIRYSLPTITDATPAVAPGTSKAHKKALTIHEDDWRQIELISASYAAAIREQFEGIGRIYDTSSDWSWLHRYLRAQPHRATNS